MKKDQTAEIIKLRAALGPVVKDVMDNMPPEYTRDEAAHQMEIEMESVDLNDFKRDIARSLVDTEETGRAVKTPAADGGQLSFKDVEDKFFSERAIYKNGDGTRAKTRKAKLQHGLVHQGSLNEKAAELTQSAMRHNLLLVCCQPYIEKNPRLTLLQAWKKYLKDNPTI